MRYVFCICYLETKYYHKLNYDLEKHGYTGLEAIVPELHIQSQSKKGKHLERLVPVLFNYGFIRMPINKALSRPFLNKLKRDIPGIKGWLKNPSSIFQKKKKARTENAEDWDDFSLVAMVKQEIVDYFLRLAKENKKYSVDELARFKIGDYLTLRQYPFEGVDAIIRNIDYVTQRVEVECYPQYGRLIVKVPFDTVFYSVYEDSDPAVLIGDDTQVILDKYSISKEDFEKAKTIRELKKAAYGNE